MTYVRCNIVIVVLTNRGLLLYLDRYHCYSYSYYDRWYILGTTGTTATAIDEVSRIGNFNRANLSTLLALCRHLYACLYSLVLYYYYDNLVECVGSCCPNPVFPCSMWPVRRVETLTILFAVTYIAIARLRQYCYDCVAARGNAEAFVCFLSRPKCTRFS